MNKKLYVLAILSTVLCIAPSLSRGSLSTVCAMGEKPRAATSAPMMPQGLVAIAGSRTVDLTWEADPAQLDIIAYNVYRSTISGRDYTRIATVKYGNYFWDTGDIHEGVGNQNQKWYGYFSVLARVSRRPIKSSNSPNPFLRSTKIKYELPEDMEVVVEIYNILGESILLPISSWLS